MQCPKCQAATQTVEYASIEVDRCTGCKGLWLDNLEAEELRAFDGAALVDTGDASVGRQYDRIDRIDCPVCHVPMIRMVHARQSHIHFESCPVCYGAFFDAGELRDLQEETVVDWFRDLIAGERKL